MNRIKSLQIPYGSAWTNVSFSREVTERLCTSNNWPWPELTAVPLKQGGIMLSADLCVPEDCPDKFLSELAQTKSGINYAFLFHDILFKLDGFKQNPVIDDHFTLTGTSLASLEDLISLLPYNRQ